ncbi:LPS export ABC transporter ATP-binding protein [Devosia sp. CAU 1758]
MNAESSPIPATAGLSGRAIGWSAQGRTILQPLDITVRRGEVVALLGPNGAGKTTLMNLLIGVHRPQTGAILIDGHDSTQLPIHARARRGVSYLPQESSVFRGLSVEDNILFYLERVVPARAERHRRLDLLLGEFDLLAIRKQNAARLSGGQRRRCEIARALAADPRYVLLDEPFAGVDPLSINQVKDLVRRLRDRGLGVLISDHNVRETISIADRAYVLVGGRLLAHGAPEIVVKNANVRRHYLGDTLDR